MSGTEEERKEGDGEGRQSSGRVRNVRNVDEEANSGHPAGRVCREMEGQKTGDQGDTDGLSSRAALLARTSLHGWKCSLLCCPWWWPAATCGF